MRSTRTSFSCVVCRHRHWITFVGNLVFIGKTESLEKAVGMSLRTWQRRKETPNKPLSQEQSGRAWKFAEILAKATDILDRRRKPNNGWSVRRSD